MSNIPPRNIPPQGFVPQQPLSGGVPARRSASAPSAYGINPTPQRRMSGSIPVQVAGTVERIDRAPTLGQYWRSDVRHTTTGRQPRWAGAAAFGIGLLSVVLLVVGSVAGLALLAAIALPLTAIAGFFALIALIAGIGRGLGFVGLLLALAGNTLVVTWVLSLFGSPA